MGNYIATEKPSSTSTSDPKTSTSPSGGGGNQQSSMLPQRGSYAQGMVLLAYVKFPKLGTNTQTGRKYVEQSSGYDLYESRARPVVVVSKSDDPTGHMLVCPLSTQDHDFNVALQSWAEAGLSSRSFVNPSSITPMHIRDSITLLGFMTETDLNRLLLNVYRLF